MRLAASLASEGTSGHILEKEGILDEQLPLEGRQEPRPFSPPGKNPSQDIDRSQ